MSAGKRLSVDELYECVVLYSEHKDEIEDEAVAIINELCVECGMTLHEIARIVGVTAAYVCNVKTKATHSPCSPRVFMRLYELRRDIVGGTDVDTGR